MTLALIQTRDINASVKKELSMMLLQCSSLALLLVGVISSAIAGEASYHVCTDAKGRKNFTTDPCSSNQSSETKKYSTPNKEVQLKTSKTAQVTSDNANRSTTHDLNPPVSAKESKKDKIFREIKADNEKRDLERKIIKSKRKLAKYEAELTEELKQVEVKNKKPKHKGDYVMWQQAINSEKSSITDKYRMFMDSENSTLKYLRGRLSRY